MIGVGRRPRPGVDIVADIADRASLHATLSGLEFDAVIHAAAWTDVDGCENAPELARQVNKFGSRYVAELAKSRDAWLIGVSTDFVFDGENGPYREDAWPEPISAYGKSKLDGEIEIRAASRSFAVARTSWVYGGAGKHFPRTVLSTLQRRGEMSVVDDEFGSPTFAGDLADVLVAMLEQKPAGDFHLSNAGATSRFTFAQEIVRLAGLDPVSIKPISTPEFLKMYPLPARRPANSSLVNTRAAALGIELPPWQDALARYMPKLTREVLGS